MQKLFSGLKARTPPQNYHRLLFLARLRHYVVHRSWYHYSRFFRRLFCRQAVHSLPGVVQMLAQPVVLPVVSRQGVLDLERSLFFSAPRGFYRKGKRTARTGNASRVEWGGGEGVLLAPCTAVVV